MTIQQLLQKIENTLQDIHILSEEGFRCIQNDQLDNFFQILEKREKKLNKLEDLRKTISQLAPKQLTMDEKENINNQIKDKIKNITKVDQKIFDIIECRRKEISEKSRLAKQGQHFLKNFKTIINFKKRVYQTI